MMVVFLEDGTKYRQIEMVYKKQGDFYVKTHGLNIKLEKKIKLIDATGRR